MKILTKKYNFKNKNLTISALLYSKDLKGNNLVHGVITLDYQNFDKYCVYRNKDINLLISDIKKLSKDYKLEYRYTKRLYHYLTNMGKNKIKQIRIHLPYDIGLELKNKHIIRV